MAIYNRYEMTGDEYIAALKREHKEVDAHVYRATLKQAQEQGMDDTFLIDVRIGTLDDTIPELERITSRLQSMVEDADVMQQKYGQTDPQKQEYEMILAIYSEVLACRRRQQAL